MTKKKKVTEPKVVICLRTLVEKVILPGYSSWYYNVDSNTFTYSVKENDDKGDCGINELPLIVKELEEAIAFSVLGIKEIYNSNRFLNKRINSSFVRLF